MAAGCENGHGLGDGADDAADLRGCDAVGRHEDDDIADGAGQDAQFCQGVADADAGAVAQVERLAGAPIAHQFDAGDEADLADVTDLREGPEGWEGVGEGLLEDAAGTE